MAKAKQNANNDILELNILDQQLRQMEEQAKLIEQQIYENQAMEMSLEEIKNKKNSEIMIPLGPGLFIPGKVDNTDKVLIHIGNKIVAKKNIDDAIEVIEKRKDKMMAAGEKITNEMQRILMKMTALESKVRSSQGHSCEECHDENCHDCH